MGSFSSLYAARNIVRHIVPQIGSVVTTTELLRVLRDPEFVARIISARYTQFRRALNEQDPYWSTSPEGLSLRIREDSRLIQAQWPAVDGELRAALRPFLRSYFRMARKAIHDHIWDDIESL
jgi:hypothetical protein